MPNQFSPLFTQLSNFWLKKVYVYVMARIFKSDQILQIAVPMYTVFNWTIYPNKGQHMVRLVESVIMSASATTYVLYLHL